MLYLSGMHYMNPSKINCKKQNYINIHIFRGVTVSEGKHSMLGERLPLYVQLASFKHEKTARNVRD